MKVFREAVSFLIYEVKATFFVNFNFGAIFVEDRQSVSTKNFLSVIQMVLGLPIKTFIVLQHLVTKIFTKASYKVD